MLEIKPNVSLENKKDTWRKIKVEENGVVLIKEFYHNMKERSALFLSSNNEILLEFTKEDMIEIYQIRNNNSLFVDEIKKIRGAHTPYYFSPDFKKFIQFEI
jgi:hypothetical protein